MVRQGSKVQIWLFFIYFNDLSLSVHGSVRLFADDTIVYLTTNINLIVTPYNKTSLYLNSGKVNGGRNPQKCEIIRLTRKKFPNYLSL